MRGFQGWARFTFVLLARFREQWDGVVGERDAFYAELDGPIGPTE